MQLDQSFELPFPRETAWAAFRDIPMLVSSLPGASLTSAPDANPLAFAFRVKLGPISANFTGQGSVAYADDFSGSLSGGGTDRATNSRVKGDAKFALHETPGGTRVDIAVEYALTGTLAQFGRPGIVKDIAAGITQRFAANLRVQLEARVVAAPTDASPAVTPPRAESEALDGMALLWSVLWGRIKQLFGARP